MLITAPSAMRRTLPAFALLAALTLAGCSLYGPGDAELVFNGHVAYVTLEGGAWVLVSDAGETYEPLNLPAEYREEGLRVRVEAEVRDDRVSLLQIGPIIEIKRMGRL